MTLNIELAVSNLREAIRGRGLQAEQDLDFLASKARQSQHLCKLEEAYIAHVAPIFFRADMTSQEMADAAMRCRHAAALLARSLKFKGDDNAD